MKQDQIVNLLAAHDVKTFIQLCLIHKEEFSPEDQDEYFQERRKIHLFTTGIINSWCEKRKENEQRQNQKIL